MMEPAPMAEVQPSFLQVSENTVDTVDHKVAEAEFFLRRMFHSNCFEFNCYSSAYLSAARSVTLAMQRFHHIEGLEAWYEEWRTAFKNDPLARTFMLLRNDHVHGGMYPVSGSWHRQGKSVRFLRAGATGESIDDIAEAAKVYFTLLLELVYDCYVGFGVHIDPQQHYSEEHFTSIGRSIDDAEREVKGWVMTDLIEDGWSEDERWHDLRGHVGYCKINHLFYAYLGKTTPKPLLPDYLEELEPSPEDNGWVHLPAGYEVSAVDDCSNGLMEKGLHRN